MLRSLFATLLLPCLTFAAGIMTLEKAIKMALDSYPELSYRELEVLSRKYKVDASRAKRWGRLKLRLGYERHSDPVPLSSIKGPGDFPTFSRDVYLWEVRFFIPLYEGGRVEKEVSLRKKEEEQSKERLELARLRLITSVKKSYAQVLFFKELVKIQEELVSDLKELLAMTEKSFSLGRASELDVLYFKRDLEKEEATLKAYKRKLALSKDILAILTGCRHTSFEVVGSIYRIPRYPGRDKALSLIEKRPDVKEAYLEVKKAECSWKRVRAEYYPEFVLSSSYGRREASGIKKGEEVWWIGAYLEWDIFDFGLRKNELLSKKAYFSSSISRLKSVKLKAKEEILKSLSDIDVAKFRIEKLKAAEKLAEEVYSREVLKYRTGAGAATDVLDAHREWLKAKVELASAYYNLQLAVFDLELATAQVER